MRLMRWGGLVMALGIALTLVALLPLVVPGLSLPSVWWFLAMLTGVGLGMICLGFWTAARERSRAVALALADPADRHPAR